LSAKATKSKRQLTQRILSMKSREFLQSRAMIITRTESYKRKSLIKGKRTQMFIQNIKRRQMLCLIVRIPRSPWGIRIRIKMMTAIVEVIRSDQGLDRRKVRVTIKQGLISKLMRRGIKIGWDRPRLQIINQCCHRVRKCKGKPELILIIRRLSPLNAVVSELQPYPKGALEVPRVVKAAHQLT
jgi:hypothetical protein